MSLQPSEYFLSALETQRSINAHINEIEPSTPVILFEIDLNEIRPATVAYPVGNANGPIVSGVLRLHNDFNLFNINRGVIQWKNNYYVPFPIFGEQFDITSNGTIPTPKLKFSSQYLDDEYNSFYKYIRMQINELKDIVGAKVTRRKTFVRYLHPDNFAGKVNPFNEFTETPWASREGDTLTVRSDYPTPPPPNMAKWLVYYPKSNYGAKAKVFTTLRNEFKNKILGSASQQQNYTVESEDYISLLLNQEIENDSDIEDAFNIDCFLISGGSNYSNIIPDRNLEFTLYQNSNKIKVLCSNYNPPAFPYSIVNAPSDSNLFLASRSFIYNTPPSGLTQGLGWIVKESLPLKNISINYPITFVENGNSLASFISFKSNTEVGTWRDPANNYFITGFSGEQPLYNSGEEYFNYGGFNTNYSIANQTNTGISISLSNGVYGKYDINYLTLTTGYYTGVNPYSNERTNLVALKITENCSGLAQKNIEINFPFSFSSMPKILFNAWSDSGFKYNQYIENVTSTGLTIKVETTGSGYHLGTQSFNILATDYICEDSNPTGAAQIFSSNANVAAEYKELLSKKRIDTYEVELVPDVYYIDRKTQEDSSNISYELASLLDIEGVKLPSRTLLSKNCPFTYRGEGCVYEYNSRLTIAHSGVYGYVVSDTKPPGEEIQPQQGAGIKALSTAQKVKGLNAAPPVADDKDNTFATHINSVNWTDRGAWGHDIAYKKNNFIFIEKNDIKYYFVCDQDHISNGVNAPPNTQYWKSDTCSKTLKGCRLRWRENPNFPNITLKATFDILSNTDVNGNVRTVEDIIYQYDVKAPIDADGNQLMGLMPFGGFPSVEGKYQTQQGAPSQQ